MTARLGNVLFAIGVLLFVGWALLTVNSGAEAPTFTVAIGLIFPAAGWALRYILTAPRT
jgi:hypothetical protein